MIFDFRTCFFFTQYVELKNKLAVVNGFNDYGDQLRQKYEDPEFESDIHSLYEEMNPLYLQLHAYVRRKLYETYGPDVINLNGMILIIFIIYDLRLMDMLLLLNAK